MSKKPLPLDVCFAEAKKYTSRAGFNKGSKAAYMTLWRGGLLDAACSHMPISPLYVPPKWTHEAVFAEAGKYKNRAEFRRCNQGAYAYALKHGLLTQACAHMRDGNGFWHVFELMAVALKYQHWSAFVRSEPQAYNFAVKSGFIELASAHMQRARTSWDKPLVLAEAAKCTSRGMFQAVAPGAYKHADKYGYLDEACAHMPPPEYGFSKERQANLYHIRMTLPDGTRLYKVGITNRDPSARLKGMRLRPGVTAEVLEVISFASGRDARIAEKRIHRKLSSHRYGGPAVMHNGNTELFTVNALDH